MHKQTTPNSCFCDYFSQQKTETYLNNRFRKDMMKNQLILESKVIKNECDQPKFYKILKKNLSVEKESDKMTSKKELTTSKGSRTGKISIKKQMNLKNYCEDNFDRKIQKQEHIINSER